MSFEIRFQGPGSIGLWTFFACVNLVNFPIMLNSCICDEKLHITYVAIEIMIISNMLK